MLEIPWKGQNFLFYSRSEARNTPGDKPNSYYHVWLTGVSSKAGLDLGVDKGESVKEKQMSLGIEGVVAS